MLFKSMSSDSYDIYQAKFNPETHCGLVSATDMKFAHLEAWQSQ